MKIALLGHSQLILATVSALTHPADVFELRPHRGTVHLGYEPTINKKVAKRLKRKAARRSNAPKGAAKPHNQRNKKGRP